MVSHNPLDYVTIAELKELGLTLDEINEAYQPSSGGVYHVRGPESLGKTLWGAHFVRDLIDSGEYDKTELIGNIKFKGKYGLGATVLKGEEFHKFLWETTHKPYRHKLIFIDEIDSEFPARFFNSIEQTEIALRMWHTAKLGNTIIVTSHKGNSTDIIWHLASHYLVYPLEPNWETNSLDFLFGNALENSPLTEWTAYDIIKTMLIYSRQELTENTEEEQSKEYPVITGRKTKQRKSGLHIFEDEPEIDLENELLGLT